MAVQLGPWHISEQNTSDEVGFTAARILNQIHTGIVVARPFVAGENGDGFLLNLNDSPAAIRTADCIPLIITTAENALALHISRLTLLHDIVTTGLNLINLEKITGLYIGPHICQRHFIFEEEGNTVKEFMKRFPTAVARTSTGTTLSLRTALDPYIAPILKNPNVTKMIDQRCTYQTHKLPSYKRWLTQNKPGPLHHMYTVISAAPLSDTTPDTAP